MRPAEPKCKTWHAPTQARQLESLVRLAEARARVDLRETVTRDDAEVASCTAFCCEDPMLTAPPAKSNDALCDCRGRMR